MNDIDSLQCWIKNWQQETFPGQSVEAKIHHLKLEVEELLQSPCDLSEAADCFILLLGIVAQNDVSSDELLQAAEEKMEINERRKWAAPDANGVCHRIKEAL